MSESNQRRDDDYDYSRNDDPDDIDRENAQDDGRDAMNRRGMMIDSDARHQAGTDLHDGSEYDRQGGAAYESRMGSGEDLQEGARGGADRLEGSDFDREESNRYDASLNAGEDDLNRRNSGTGETDARYMHQTSNLNSSSNVGDEGFSDAMTPAAGGQGPGAVRTDWEGDYSLAETEETQADYFQHQRNEQGDRDAGESTEKSQADYFQKERRAQGADNDQVVAQPSAGARRKSKKRDGGKTKMTNTSNTRTVAAVFRDWNDATRAVGKLQDVGFDDDQIGIARLDTESGNLRQESVSGEKKDDGEKVAGGIAAGAAVGGVAGLLAALASLAIPGVGPIVAGGMLATTFGTAAGTAIAGAGVGAGIGAAAGGLIGALTSLGLSEDEARWYESGMRSGGTLVTVRAGARADEAIRMLQQMGGETHSSAGGKSGSSSDPNWRFG